jgi:DNA-binding NarL/FixJ family response regulator
MGYLTKDAGAREIQEAIRTVRSGEALLDPGVQRRLIEHVRGAANRRARPEPSLPDGLTPREAEVLSLIAEGLSNMEIAARLVVTEATVKTHINNIFSKAAIRDRAQAVVYAMRHGLTG